MKIQPIIITINLGNNKLMVWEMIYCIINVKSFEEILVIFCTLPATSIASV